jgi:ribosomal protein S18 acetylase RimI-like enzyme
MLGAMDGVVIRAAGAGDATFLQDMLVEAANTPSHPGRSRADTLADPAVARYVEEWPRATDLGVVAAETGGRAVGAAWLRFFTEADPAYGFVRVGIPELAIGVAADWRGHGVGRALLRALAGTARQRGLEHISLSVERANPAAGLYYAEGYRVVESRECADTMLLDLWPSEDVPRRHRQRPLRIRSRDEPCRRCDSGSACGRRFAEFGRGAIGWYQEPVISAWAGSA